MLYINFDKIKFTPSQYFLLCAVSQQTAKNNMEDIIAVYLNEDTDKLIEEGYIDSRKATKKDSELSILKITKKGKTALKNVSERSEPYDDDDEKLENWLHTIYSKRPNFEKSNREQTKRLLNWFKYETDIMQNELSNLLLCFLNDTFITESTNQAFWDEYNEAKLSNKRLQLSNKLEYILFKPKDRFQRKPNLEQSLLWDYYNENKEYVDKQFNLNTNK